AAPPSSAAAKPAGSAGGSVSAAAKPAASGATSASAAPAASGLQTVRIGVLNVISDIAIFAAQDAGFFRQQGINLETPVFRATQDMIAPMAAGQLDVGTGALNAGLFNAIKREIPLRVVADKATT